LQASGTIHSRVGVGLKSRASGKGAAAPQMFLHKIHLFT
jgi:hypothetical protein